MEEEKKTKFDLFDWIIFFGGIIILIIMIPSFLSSFLRGDYYSALTSSVGVLLGMVVVYSKTKKFGHRSQ